MCGSPRSIRFCTTAEAKRCSMPCGSPRDARLVRGRHCGRRSRAVGRGRHHRVGFERVVAEVCLGKVGAVGAVAATAVVVTTLAQLRSGVLQAFVLAGYCVASRLIQQQRQSDRAGGGSICD